MDKAQELNDKAAATAAPPRLLVCDDEKSIRFTLKSHLEGQGYSVVTANDGTQCLTAVEKEAPDLVMLDLNMPGMGGLETLSRLRAAERQVPVIVVTADDNLDSAVQATRMGASAYIQKPLDLAKVSHAVQEALQERWRRVTVRPNGDGDEGGRAGFIGVSPALDSVYEMVDSLARVDGPTVLITGESGTGKDVLARAIHELGRRQGGSFTAIDCAALPENLIESELFGHERGAFTGATTTKKGLLEVASDGTVFLDEIGEMPLGTQVKLLRALENRTFRRVGGTTTIELTAGVIAATNRDLAREVRDGRFREDLYYRLKVIPIHLPPLRQRKDDIPLLVGHILRIQSKRFGRQIDGTTEEALRLLQQWHWPGNVRELRNVLERIVVLGAGGPIRAADLPWEIRMGPFAASEAARGCPFELPPEGIDLEAVEQGLIVQALDRTGGNQAAAGRLLGITRYAIRYRAAKFGLEVD